MVANVTPAAIPANLPTGDAVPAEFVTLATEAVADPVQSTNAFQTLEDMAHQHKVLISSDAMEYFATVCKHAAERPVQFTKVLEEATYYYPTEDGWVVLNLPRMQELCARILDEVASVTIDQSEKTVPTNTEATLAPITNSLAEAIIDGNVIAAYKLIDNRPMVALAGASADFDALYRYQNGEEVVLSDILEECAATIPQEKVKVAIDALTQTVDGTYPSEEAAVKVAIMKAIKALA